MLTFTTLVLGRIKGEAPRVGVRNMGNDRKTANMIHDGSEVMIELFPQASGDVQR